MSQTKYRLEAVWWEDHCTSVAWQHVDPESCQLSQCFSVGLVVHEDKNVLVLASTVSKDAQMGNVMSRGKKLITKRKFIKWIYV